MAKWVICQSSPAPTSSRQSRQHKYCSTEIMSKPSTPAVTRSSTCLTTPVKDGIRALTNRKCWLCKVEGKQIAHLFDAADPTLVHRPHLPRLRCTKNPPTARVVRRTRRRGNNEHQRAGQPDLSLRDLPRQLRPADSGLGVPPVSAGAVPHRRTGLPDRAPRESAGEAEARPPQEYGFPAISGA